MLGFGSGDPKTKYNYTGDETQTFYGRAQLVLRRTGDDPITVTVSDGELESTLNL